MKQTFANAYISIMGDSLSTYEGYLPEGYPAFYSYRNALVAGILNWRETWWGQVIEHFGAHLLVNNSWSGSFVCKPVGCEIESYGCSDARVNGLAAEGCVPDHILVCLGTNDRGAGFRLTGTDPSDLSVIENAYGVMLDKMKARYPQAEIWCCTFPVTTCSRDPDYVFPRTQKWGPTECYGACIAAVARARGCHVIDLWDEEKPCDTIDGLHPNYAGMCAIAERVIRCMESGSVCG